MKHCKEWFYIIFYWGATQSFNLVAKSGVTEKFESSYFELRKSLGEVKTFFRFLEILFSIQPLRALHFHVTWMSHIPPSSWSSMLSEFIYIILEKLKELGTAIFSRTQKLNLNYFFIVILSLPWKLFKQLIVRECQ